MAVSTTCRWEYPREGSADDEFTVNYHPGLLLIWGGNVHVQRVTSAAWRTYLLKYVHKYLVNGPVDPKLPDAADAFGLPSDVPLSTLQTAAATLQVGTVFDVCMQNGCVVSKRCSWLSRMVAISETAGHSSLRE